MRKIIVLILLATGTFSCKKFLDVDMPIDKLTTENVFSNDASAVSAVTGVYSQMQAPLPYIFSGGVTINAGLAADELGYTGTSADIQSFQQNNIAAASSIIANDFWPKAYNTIYHINACLEGLEKSTEVTAPVKQQLSGELYFLRAYTYFYLVNLFGNVPLETGTNYIENSMAPRATVDMVYQQLTADLTRAADLLPATYPTTGKGRANKWAAKSLLARVELYRNNWAAAESLCNEVIGSGAYSLAALNNVFLANSSEAIWQLVPVSTTFNTVEGNRFIPVTTTLLPTYYINTGLLNAFSTGDQRKTAWTKTNTVSGTPYTYPYKYKVRSSTTYTEYYMMIRLAELYLIRTEAKAQQDKIAEAKADLNMTRARAGLPATTANDKLSLLAAIEQERRLEFFAEWGHRWLDLKRWGRADVVLGTKPGWQTTDALWPIPEKQLLLNQNLTQNPGY